LTSQTDNTLMLKVKDGDLDQMGLLFERHHKQMFGFLYHSTGSKSSSEDMVQTVFYRMIKYKHTFTGEGEFKTWMYHLTRNVLKDHFRKNTQISFKSDLSSLDKIGENVIEEKISESQDHEQLHKALQKITENHREVLVLSRFQDLSYKEIGTILEISEANVKVRVHRAIVELRNIFQKLN
jgi:RNA polymerase sigma factor (sigma-70 family)